MIKERSNHFYYVNTLNKNACVISQYKFHCGFVNLHCCSFKCSSCKLKWNFVPKHECNCLVNKFYFINLRVVDISWFGSRLVLLCSDAHVNQDAEVSVLQYLLLKIIGFWNFFYARYFPRSWSTPLASPLWSFVYLFLYSSHWNNSRYGNFVITHFKYIAVSTVLPMLIKTLMLSRLPFIQSKADIPTSQVYVNSSMLNMKKILQVLNLPR